MKKTMIDRIAALKCWRGSITLEPLSGGMTNLNFIVLDGETRFVARICEDRHFLGIDRTNESHCQTAAHHIGVAPSVAHLEDGIMVLPFIDGKTLSNPDFQNTQILRRVASTLRLLHDSRDRLTKEMLFFCPFQTVRTYTETARSLGANLPPSIDGWVNDSRFLQHRIQAFHPTLCHNDLLASNIMDDGHQLWIVDWEYAGIGNPIFDLASVSTNSGLSDELEIEFLHAYYGRKNHEAFIELQILKTVSILREALWAVIQTVMSKISFDYTSYAAENFSAYERASYEINQLLKVR